MKKSLRGNPVVNYYKAKWHRPSGRLQDKSYKKVARRIVKTLMDVINKSPLDTFEEVAQML